MLRKPLHYLRTRDVEKNTSIPSQIELVLSSSFSPSVPGFCPRCVSNMMLEPNNKHTGLLARQKKIGLLQTLSITTTFVLGNSYAIRPVPSTRNAAGANIYRSARCQDFTTERTRRSPDYRENARRKCRDSTWGSPEFCARQTTQKDSGQTHRHLCGTIQGTPEDLEQVKKNTHTKLKTRESQLTGTGQSSGPDFGVRGTQPLSCRLVSNEVHLWEYQSAMSATAKCKVISLELSLS